MKRLTLLFLIVSIANAAIAQDTLPKFSVRNIGGNRIVIGWVNKFESVKQISIQRSFDSLKNYKTILTVADPSIPENGFVDSKANNDHMFYRLYIMLDKGVFLFSDVRKPVIDTFSKRNDKLKIENANLWVPLVADSLNAPFVSGNRPKAEKWAPSRYVFTSKDGYIRISLPEDEDKKYSIRFFTASDELLFELKDIKERNFKIDKANFYRSGWFHFEMYENGELKEKNKFFLPKEF